MSAKSSPALRLSLGVNVLLLAIIGLLFWRESPPTPTFSAPALVSPPPAKVPVAVAAARSEPAPTGSAPPNSAAPKLTPAAVAELEQAGIPRDILVSVLLADLNRRWTAQGAALQKKYAPAPMPERAQRELSRRTVTEQVGELRGALGEEGYRAWDKEQTLLALNRARPPGDQLPMNAAEAEQAYRLQKAFDDENRELQEAMEDGVATMSDAGKLQAQAQQALDRELEKLLGKERFNALRGNSAPDSALAQAK